MGGTQVRRTGMWRRAGAVGIVGALGIVSVSCSNQDDNAPSPAALSVEAGNVVVDVPTGSVSDPAARLTVTAQVPPADAATVFGDAVSPLGEGVQVSLDGGELIGPAQVSFDLPAGFDASRYVPGVVWDAGDGTWELLDSSWAPGDSTVRATTTHFSIGWPIKIDVSQFANGIADWVKGLVTGRSNVSNPTCGDEVAARSGGVQVISDVGDLVKWCYGQENGRNVVKVSNNWRAGTQVMFPDGWEVVEYQGAGANLQALGDWLDSISRENATNKARLVGAGQTIVLAPTDIPAGTMASVVAEPSTVSWMWSIALTGVDMYLLTLGKLARIDDNVKAADLLDSVAFIKCYTDYFGEDIDALAPVDATSTFDTLTKVSRFAIDCGKDIIQNTLSARGGILGKIGAQIVGVLAGVIGVAYGLVNALFAGIRQLIDDVGELFTGADIGAFGYDIVLENVGPPAPTQESPEPGLQVIAPDRRSGTTLVECDAQVSADIGEAILARCSGDWATGQRVAYVEGGCADCDGMTLFERVGGAWTERGGCLYRSVIIAGSKGCTEMWVVPPEALCEIWLNSDLGALWETGCPPWMDRLERAQTEPCTYYSELDRTDDSWGPAFGTCKKGPLVQQVQSRLVELGYEIDADGFFGPKSARAIAHFQRAQGLTVSAVIDPPSITALLG